jgi:transcriptional regulator with XRE-family HTH domain
VESLEEWLTQPEGMATRLRALRTQAGLSGKQLAGANDWQQSKVSKIENGRQMPTVEDIDAWARTCSADESTVRELQRLREEAQVTRVTFRSHMRHGQKKVQEDYDTLGQQSHLIRNFETVLVPGILQIPDYTRRVLGEMIPLHDLEIDDVDAAVTARMQRQQVLYDPSKSFEFLIAEPVLRWLICPPAVMRAQLDRLQTVIGLDRVRFGILPMGVELPWTPQNSFALFVSSDDPVAIVESFFDELSYRGNQYEIHSRMMDRLWEKAVTGEEARQLIIAATRALGRSEVT